MERAEISSPEQPESDKQGCQETAELSSVNRKADADTLGIVITALAAYPPDTLLDETALAKVIMVTKRTIRSMVSRYELPPSQPFAGRSTWLVGRILRWVHARAEELEQEALRNAKKLRAVS